MGTTKTAKFTKRQLRLSAMAKALGHPARIAILEVLVKQGTCICGDIVDKLPLSQATISQHLKELKAAGIIKGEISGVKTCYCINEKTWKDVESLLSQFFIAYEPGKNSC